MIRVADGEEIDFVTGKEVVIGVAVDVHADADDSDSFGAEAALEFDEGRHFFDTGGTPGSPEIQDQDFALEVVDVDFAVGVLRDEFWGERSDAGRTRATVAPG